MNILLHPDKDGGLSEHYKRAFGKAIELFIVTAYLTEWDSSLILNSNCKDFRVIIGKDFGITRKAACESVMKWLPSERKNQFLVVDMISGFHPKAVFWKESSENYFTIIGSSNLTNAAFNTNFEANAFSSISKDEYNAAKRWVRDIEKLSVIVSEDWLLQYKESTPIRGISRVKSNKNNTKNDKIQLIAFKLPRPKNIDKLIKERRKQLDAYNKNSADIIKLFRECADRKIESDDFYNEISKYWSYEEGNRLQGAGWERTGRDSNFMLLSQSYINIFNALPDDRDNVVIKEIDRLKEQQVATRGAFLSEMLCLQFPEEYPVLNKPVKNYIKAIDFKAPRGASEGVRYIDLAKKLRLALLQDKEYPAKNLAELDTVIWSVYSD